MIWHSAKTQDIINSLHSSPKKGLSTDDAEEMLSLHGENVIIEKEPKSIIQRFFAQLKDFMVIILMIAAVLSIGITIYRGENDWIEPIAIIAIVIVNAIFGVLQETKAEKALEALKNMSAPKSKVLRDGKTNYIPTKELVRGDIILLEAGDFVPADARILEASALQCDESALTGESVPAEKSASEELGDITPLADRINMLYSGCVITYGHGRAIVVETGMETEMGKVAALLNSGEQPVTPLQVKLQRLGKTLGALALVICLVIFAVGMFSGIPFMEMLITSVSLAVAAVPEGLPAIVTVTLALGVQRMVKRNAVIRSLPAVETLGSASVICSDKTGTLTYNRMTMVRAWVQGEEDFDLSQNENSPSEKISELLKLACLCCDTKLEKRDGEDVLIGDPTENALVAAAAKYGYDKNELDVQLPRVAEIPFDSERKLMTAVHVINGQPIAIVKGAPEILFERCCEGDIEAAQKANELFAGQALRVLAIACKPLNSIPTNPGSEELENMLTFVGLVGLIDPPREEAKKAIEKCKSAGIKPVMITGDHVLTACAIAKELGIFNAGDKAMTGAELSALSDEQLDERIESTSVYARVSPEDKIRIVRAWQKKGKVVSMTGDGVNDAPALRAADIGCAMGVTGTDVAKGAAAMVLTDDNFATIVGAVEEGRGIYENIRKAVRFLLGCNLGELLTVLTAIILGWGAPLSAIQLLWINLVTDSLPALALSMEKPDADIMQKPPRKRDESIFAQGLGIKAVLEGLMFAVLTVAAYVLGRFVLTDNIEAVGQTMAFAVLAFSQIIHANNVRSEQSLLRAGFNKYMLGAFGVSCLMMLLALATPLSSMFKLAALNKMQIMCAAGLSVVPLIIEEAVKLIAYLRKKMLKQSQLKEEEGRIYNISETAGADEKAVKEDNDISEQENKEEND